MTVQTNTNVASFNGNGLTQIFPIAFKFNNDTDLVVLRIDDATGAATVLTLNSDYTVSGEGDEEGGLINVVLAPAVGQRLKVSRIVDILQLLDLRNQGKFFAEVHEDAFDLLTMIAQQHESAIRSSIRVADADPEPARLPAAVLRANRVMGFDENGNPVATLPASGSGTELALMLLSANGVTYVTNAVDKRELSNSQDPLKGAATVGFASSERAGPHNSVGAALSAVYRAGKTGIFRTSTYIPTHRAGPMAYRKQVGGRAELLTDLSRFLPAGARRIPTPKRQVFAQLAISSFASTGSPDVYRYISTAHDFWGAAGTEQLQAAVIDNSTGRKYLDSRFFPGTDYSCNVVNSAGFGGLTVEIKQPAGVAAPTSIVVELAYPVSGENRAIYVDPVNGNDAFDGSSFDWPMKTIPAAITKAPEVIFIRPGVYAQSNYPGAYTSANDVAIKVVGGRAQFVSLATTFSAWSLDSGTTYVTTVGGSPTPVGVVDLLHFDEFGAPRILTQAASLAECRSTPNSFWYDAGPRNMYANLIDGSAPTVAGVMPYGAGNTLRHSSAAAKVYVSDVDFIGGTGGAISARDAGLGGVLVAERCRFLGNYNSNGADIKDIGLAIFIDCSAAYNANDGFNYGAFNGISPHFIEVGCFGYSNRAFGTGNGTTSHDNCVGFRINCDAAFNAGPGFADVNNSNTLSVNVTSRANGPSVNASGFRSDGASSSMYLDGASADGNSGADFEATDGATLRARDAYGKKYAGTMAVMI